VIRAWEKGQSGPSGERTVITTFHVIQLAAVLIGAIAGYRSGYSVGGTAAALLGAILGVSVGWFLGRLPFYFTLRSLLRALKGAASPELRSRLDREYFISHLIIAELISRGESVESFRSVVVSQLRSPSADVRRFGTANASVWFPQLLDPTNAR
jgi:hypothetical protein